MDMPDRSSDERLAKYRSLSSLSQDFIALAEAYSCLIVDEMALAPADRTLQPTLLGGVAGGQKYVIAGIVFKFARDPPLSSRLGPEANSASVPASVVKPSIATASSAAGNHLQPGVRIMASYEPVPGDTPVFDSAAAAAERTDGTARRWFLYGGSAPCVEFAAKAAGHDLRGSAQYVRVANEISTAAADADADAGINLTSEDDLKSQSAPYTRAQSEPLPGTPHRVLNSTMPSSSSSLASRSASAVSRSSVRVPMTALVDYKGYRLTAMSLLPIDASSLVYGSRDAGLTVHADDSSFNSFMVQAAQRLHLAGHSMCGACVVSAMWPLK